MVRIGLQLKAVLENITDLRPESNDFRWYLKLRCANCGEQTQKWVYVTLMEQVPLKGGRGSANMVAKCKMCGRENSLGILEDTITPYTAADSGQFKTIVGFECRGLEPVDFEPRAGFHAVGEESGMRFSNINLTEKVSLTTIIARLIGGFTQTASEGKMDSKLTRVHAVCLRSEAIWEWTDYDENAQQPVSILEVEHQFIKL